jgi:hypothetical protein
MSEENVKLSELIPQDKVSKLAESLKLLDSIESVEIKTQDQYENAAEVQKSIKKSIKELEKDRKDIVKPFNDKVKMVNVKYKEVTNKLDNGANKIGNALSVYYQEQKRIADEKQRKLEAEAEEKRRKAEDAAKKEQEKADKYRDEGRDEMAAKAEARAETKIDEAATTVAQEVKVEKPKGLSFRTDYDIKIEDMSLAVQSILSNEFLEDLILQDDKIKDQLESSLKKIAKTKKGNLKIKGVKVTEKQVPITRT